MAHARLDDRLSLRASTFDKRIHTVSLQVGRSLFVSNHAVVSDGGLNLDDGKVDGHLFLDASTLGSGINANIPQVGGSLLLIKEALVK
jgi:hypothetical protein